MAVVFTKEKMPFVKKCLKAMQKKKLATTHAKV